MTAAEIKKLRDVRLVLEGLWSSTREMNPVFGTATMQQLEEILDRVVALIARAERRPLDTPPEPDESEET